MSVDLKHDRIAQRRGTPDRQFNGLGELQFCAVVAQQSLAGAVGCPKGRVQQVVITDGDSLDLPFDQVAGRRAGVRAPIHLRANVPAVPVFRHDQPELHALFGRTPIEGVIVQVDDPDLHGRSGCAIRLTTRHRRPVDVERVVSPGGFDVRLDAADGTGTVRSVRPVIDED